MRPTWKKHLIHTRNVIAQALTKLRDYGTKNRLSVNSEEKSLREMLSSVHRESIGNFILTQVTSGEPVTIRMGDGSTLLLADLTETLEVLQSRFGWEPESFKARPRTRLRLKTDKAAAHVFSMCERMERGFTMKEIVARVLHERPTIALQFAEIWGRLIQSKLIKVHKAGEVDTYEVAMWHSL
jgi:hypothetical protein